MPHPHQRSRNLADSATRATAMTTVSGLAALAGWISYHHMVMLAERAGEYGMDAHAFPLTVDGLDLIGVLVLLADRRTHRDSGWLPWTVLALGTLASIAANIAVAPANPIARAISGWSAVALLAAAKMLAHLLEPLPTSALSIERGHIRTSGHDTDAPATVFIDPGDVPPATSTRRPDLVPAIDIAEPSDGMPDNAARRLPASDAALTRWRHIWQATQHLDHATRDTATRQGVSLRTLQFIRAAGQAGHLQSPTAAVSTARETASPGATPTAVAEPPR